MSHRNFIKNSIAALLPIALGLGVLLGVNKKPIEKAEASSYSVSSIPKNLDLNDSTETEIRNYYNGLTNKTSDQLSGTNLLKNLKPILKNGQKYYSYGSSATTAVWQAYEIVDRDWEKSPASKISGYNASTNTVTGYTYGTSNSSPGSNPYVHALYVNRSVTNQTRAWGNHNQDQWGINQEHVWAKSCGFNDNSPAAGARGDLMHLWAGNGKVNGTYHSNYYYGYVDKTKSYDDAKDYATTLSGNLKGYSKTKGGSYTVFEPQDSDKGDIARAIFYMAARYNYLSGSDSDGIDAGNPNLEIVNQLDWAPGTSYQSTTSKKGKMGILQDLLEWNRLDPPDTWEIHRNNLLFKNYTYNRNPFIDFPEWAEYIWGKSVDGSYNSSSTGSANPTSNVINKFSGGATPSVTSVTVTPSSSELNLSGVSSVSLKAEVVGTNNPDQTVTWTSTNTNVATVNSSGVVTAKATGSATIKATSTLNTSKYGECSITVHNSNVPVAGVSLDKNAMSITEGSSELLTETVTPSNASDQEVIWTTSNASVATVSSGIVHAVAPGSATITVTTEDGGFTATCTVTVTGSGSQESGSYTWDLSTASYSEASTTAVTWESSYATMGIEKGTSPTNCNNYLGDKNSSSRFYNGHSFSLSPVGSYYINRIVFSATSTGYADAFVNSSWVNASATALESTVTVTPSIANNSISGTISATCGFTSATVYYEIPLNPKTVVGIEVDSSQAQTSFRFNGVFSSEGLAVTAYFDDESDDLALGFVVSEPDLSVVGDQDVTVTFGPVEATYTINVFMPETSKDFEKVTSESDIEDGGRYVILGCKSGDSDIYYGMQSYKSGNNIPGVEVQTTENGTKLNELYMFTTAVYTLESTGDTDEYYISDGTQYLYAAGTGTANHLKATAEIPQDDSKYSFTISFSKGSISVVAASSNRNTMRFNSGSTLFSCYASNESESAVMFFKEVTEEVTYSMVTDVTTLGTGDEVLFVGIQNDSYYQATTITYSDLRAAATDAPVNNKVEAVEGATAFQVVREGNYLRFKDSVNGYLSSVETGSNYCKYEAEGSQTNKSLYSVAIGNDGMVSSMVGQDTSFNCRSFKFHPTTTTKRFTFYTITNTYAVNFYIYKKTSQVEADVWATSFLSGTQNCNTTNWSSYGTSYQALKQAAKEEIITCPAVNDSNYCARSQAMARYEYILAHYEVSNFIAGRNVSPAKPNTLPILFGKKTTLTVIIIVSVIGVSAIGGYFFMKSRRKEEF